MRDAEVGNWTAEQGSNRTAMTLFAFQLRATIGNVSYDLRLDESDQKKSVILSV
jgi:hypothetical protein